VAADRPLAVVFWSRFCAPAVAVLPAVQATAHRLAARGVSLVLVADESPSAEAREFLRQKGVEIPVFFDSRREAAVAFRNWGTPAHYLVDARGRIRFEDVGRVEDLVLQAAVVGGP